MSDVLSNSMFWSGVFVSMVIWACAFGLFRFYVKGAIKAANDVLFMSILGAWEKKAYTIQGTILERLAIQDDAFVAFREDNEDKAQAIAGWCANAARAGQDANKAVVAARRELKNWLRKETETLKKVNDTLNFLVGNMSDIEDKVTGDCEDLLLSLKQVLDGVKRLDERQQRIVRGMVATLPKVVHPPNTPATVPPELYKPILTVLGDDANAAPEKQDDVKAMRQRIKDIDEMYQDPPMTDASPKPRPVVIPPYPYRRKAVEKWLEDYMNIFPEIDEPLRYPRVGWTTNAVQHWLMHESDVDVHECDTHTSDARFKLVKQQRQCDGEWCDQDVANRLLTQYPLDLLFSLTKFEQEALAEKLEILHG